ncbi:hypothetical protein ES705_39374 [subsurface metagenome]
MRIKKEKPRCPKCDSANILVSRKETPAVFWCRRCNFSGSKQVFFRKRENQEYDEEYIFLTMLKFAYTILTKEGYLGEHLDELFFPDGYPDDIAYKTFGEWKKHIAREDSKKVAEEFFYKDPRGIKLRKEIDKLSGNFNQ